MYVYTFICIYIYTISTFTWLFLIKNIDGHMTSEYRDYQVTGKRNLEGYHFEESLGAHTVVRRLVARFLSIRICGMVFVSWRAVWSSKKPKFGIPDVLNDHTGKRGALWYLCEWIAENLPINLKLTKVSCWWYLLRISSWPVKIIQGTIYLGWLFSYLQSAFN